MCLLANLFRPKWETIYNEAKAAVVGLFFSFFIEKAVAMTAMTTNVWDEGMRSSKVGIDFAVNGLKHAKPLIWCFNGFFFSFFFHQTCNVVVCVQIL